MDQIVFRDAGRSPLPCCTHLLGSGASVAVSRFGRPLRQSTVPAVVHRILCTIAIVVLSLILVSQAQAAVDYVYDEAGRLVQVVAPSGESARYEYDAAGNLIAVRRSAAGSLTIAEFTPVAGPVGTAVTLFGTGFSLTPSANSVSFGGVAASVTSASANRLVAQVPMGAVSGPVSVSVGSSTATSTRSFTVTSGPVGPGPMITGFAPVVGTVGTAVTINGSNFDALPTNNVVRIGPTDARVTGASPTQVTVSVPANGSSGQIELQTAHGIATSGSIFHVVRAPFTTAQVALTGQISSNGLPISIGTIPAGKIAVLALEGNRGQGLGLALGPVTFAPSGGSANVYIVAPDGTQVFSQSFSGPAVFNVSALPATGLYSVIVAANASSSVTATLTLTKDAAGVLTANGAPLTFSASVTGQNARYTFDAAAGQDVSLLWTGSTFTGGTHYISVNKPDGTQLTYSSFTTGAGFLDLRNLPATGTYTVFLDPYQGGTGQLSLQLRADALNSIAVDGTSVSVTMAAGQNGEIIFTGAVGQNLGLGISGFATSPAGGALAVTVYSPTGATVIANCGSASAGCTLPPLPSTGTYTLRLDPGGTYSASLTLTLSSDVVGVLVANDPATVFSTTRIGQGARYTFYATAGQNASVRWSGATFPGSSNTLSVFKPDGTQLAFGSMGAGAPAGVLDLRSLPATGTYTVVADPYQGNTGQVSVQLLMDSPGSLAVDGAPLPVTLLAGQNGTFTFSGNVGQRLGLGASSLTTTPSGSTVSLTVYGPDNATTIATCGGYYAPGGACNLPPLPSSGTYTVKVDPATINAATLTLTLSSNAAAVLVANGPGVTFSTSRIGQDGRFTFDATAGQNASVLWSGATFSGSNGRLYVYRPDGVELATNSFGAGIPSGTLDFRNLPATGTYAVVVDPYQTTTGQVTLQLLTDLPGTLAPGGAALPVTLAAGQNGEFTFDGVLGARLGLGISNVVTTPGGGYVTVTVYGPDNVTIVQSCGSYYAAGGSCNLPPLPSTGRYTVRIDSYGTYGTSLSMSLSDDLTGTLVPNGAAVAFSTARPGQNGRYAFDAAAGQNASLVWNGANFGGSLAVFRPDGTSLSTSSFSASTSSGTLVLTNLPATGTYTVVVDPTGINTGAINVLLTQSGETPPASQTVNGSLQIDGTPSTITMTAGQKVRYTFSGTVGQRLGIGVSSMTTTPAGGYVMVSVYAPDNATLVGGCGTYYSPGGECDLPPLPSTGTYTVRIDPATYAANLTLTLTTDVNGVLVTNGVPMTFSTARIGQNALFTFDATAGQDGSLTWSGATFAGSSTPISIRTPGGALLATPSIGSSSASGAVDLRNLPATGTYTVFVDPYQTTTGQVSLQLLMDVPGTLNVNGAPLPVTLLSGQNGEFTFEGVVGQRLGLGVGGLTTSPVGGSVMVSILAPDNVTLVVNCDSAYASNGGGSCNVPPLPATGTYRVRVDAAGTYGASFALTLSSDLTGTLTANAPALAFSSTRVGQNARYTFDATAGQNGSILWTNATIGAATIYVYKPDGTQWASATVGTSAQSGTLDLRNLPATGTYTVLVDPTGAATGAINLQLLADAPGSLAIDGAPLPVLIAPGQNGSFAFQGDLGQRLSIGWNNVTATPANGYAVVTTYRPDGAVLKSCDTMLAGGSCDLPALPFAGTYLVVVDPIGTAAIGATLTLSSEQSEVMLIDAPAATTFATIRVGQNARYLFDATAGQDLSFAWSGATFPNSSLMVSRPDGSFLTNAYPAATSSPSGMVELRNLPATGRYTILVNPSQADVGRIDLNLRADIQGVLVADGASLGLAFLPGQNAGIRFEGVLGQKLALDMGGLTTTPPSSSVTVTLLAPDNQTSVITCTQSITNGTCNLPMLPSTGTYTIRIVPSWAAAATLTLKLYGVM